MERGGIEPDGRPSLFSNYSNHAVFPGDHAALYLVTAFWQHPWQPDGGIAEARFFPSSELPEDATRATRRRVDEVVNGAERDGRW